MFAAPDVNFTCPNTEPYVHGKRFSACSELPPVYGRKREELYSLTYCGDPDMPRLFVCTFPWLGQGAGALSTILGSWWFYYLTVGVQLPSHCLAKGAFQVYSLSVRKAEIQLVLSMAL